MLHCACVTSPTEALRSGNVQTTGAATTNRAQVLNLSIHVQDSQPGTVLLLPAKSTADWLQGMWLDEDLAGHAATLHLLLAVLS